MMSSSFDKQICRALIIDDEEFFQDIIGEYFKLLTFDYVAVSSFDNAIEEIKNATRDNNPFSIVTIDNEFNVSNSAYRLGKNILQRLKLTPEYSHLNIGCIMITATRFSEREVLDLRDKFGLDYFIPKNELDVESLQEGIRIASNPHRPSFNVDDLVSMPNEKRRFSVLNETLNIYRNMCLIYDRNLAVLRGKKARQGGDVSLKIENEIQECETNLVEAEKKIHIVEIQLKNFDTE